MSRQVAFSDKEEKQITGITLEQKPFEGMFSILNNKLYLKEFLFAFQVGIWDRYSAAGSHRSPCACVLPFWSKCLSLCLSHAFKHVVRTQLKMWNLSKLP